MSKELVISNNQGVFNTIQAFEDGQRIAKALSTSDLVPEAYKGNVSNTMVALEMASRINASPFMVMQNLHIIKGKPSWSSTFIIAALNSCGRFTPLRFKFEGTPKTDEYGCRAVAKDVRSGEELKGTLINWRMVKAEGWLNKGGSKWKTMPELMFQYRAAAFFGRVYAPDIINGMHSKDEMEDVHVVEVVDQDEVDLQEDIKRLAEWVSKAETIDDLEVIEDNWSGDIPAEAKQIIDAKKAELKGE